MVVINMHMINAVMFVLCCLSGSMGVLLLWMVVWFPIAGSIKMEFKVKGIGRAITNRKTNEIPIEGGGTIQATSTTTPTADMSIGMSMGSP